MADAEGRLDWSLRFWSLRFWSLHFVDGTVVRAHQHAAGAKKGGGDQALGRSRGGLSTKIHIRAERRGKPVVVALTGGERHEYLMLPRLMDDGMVKPPGVGRPRVRPTRVAGDKGDSGRSIRRYQQRRGIVAVIPRRSNKRPNPFFDRQAYCERNQIERLINRLKQYRRIATRYEKLAAAYHAMLTVANLILWL